MEAGIVPVNLLLSRFLQMPVSETESKEKQRLSEHSNRGVTGRPTEALRTHTNAHSQLRHPARLGRRVAGHAVPGRAASANIACGCGPGRLLLACAPPIFVCPPSWPSRCKVQVTEGADVGRVGGLGAARLTVLVYS